MISTKKSLALFRDYLRSKPDPVPSGMINIDVSEKLHTRILNLFGKRNKNLTYTFNFPETENLVTLHRRSYVGELPVGTRFISSRETPNGLISILHIVTQFEVDHGFVPEEHVREVRRFEGPEKFEEIGAWMDARSDDIKMVRLPGIWRLDFANDDVEFEFRHRWE